MSLFQVWDPPVVMENVKKKGEIRQKEEPRRCFLGLGLGVKFARFHTSERE